MSRTKPGFTLLELLLYIAIVAGIVTVIGNILTSNQRVAAKAHVMSDVSENAMQIINTIENYLIQAESITSPTIGNSANNLQLTTFDGDNVSFTWNSGVLRVNINAGGNQNLSSNIVNVDSISFLHLDNSGAESVRVRLQLSSLNTSGRKEYDYTSNFYTTVSLR